MNGHDSLNLNSGSGSGSVPVPVFNCIVYLAKAESGIVARVVNLAGIEATGASERDVLAKIVPAFKERIVELMSAGVDIPWVEPLPAPGDDEQQRLIPVHL